jgi:hypothetical protein
MLFSTARGTYQRTAFDVFEINKGINPEVKECETGFLPIGNEARDAFQHGTKNGPADRSQRNGNLF